MLGGLEGQHVVVARHRLGLDRHSVLDDRQHQRVGLRRVEPFNTRAVKPPIRPRTVSPIMPRVTFFLRRTSAVSRTSGPLPPVSFT